jgi:hypothetical protein
MSPVRWFTFHSRFASWLALAALALQLVVSFGHVHLDGIARAGPAGIAAVAGAQAPQAVTAQHRGGDGDDDYCAICATIYLAANSFLPPAPQLPVPFVSRIVEHFDRIAVVFITPRRSAFQSRAPPLA